MNIYNILGRPGAGKGVCAQTVKGLARNIGHLSVGDLLRQEARRRTPVGQRYEKQISGSLELIPCSVVWRLVQKELNRALGAGRSIIIDGYPRTQRQANLLQGFALTKKVRLIYIYLDAAPQLCIERLITRESCIDCGYDYILTRTKKPHCCDFCGKALVKRPTDTTETLWKRMTFFDQTTRKVVETLYKQDSFEIITLNANKNLDDLAQEFACQLIAPVEGIDMGSGSMASC